MHNAFCLDKHFVLGRIGVHCNGQNLIVVDIEEAIDAGIKSATIKVSGQDAYGMLKGEKGVHRLVRISPFNAQGKRQTSFASLDVMPELADDNEVEINNTPFILDLALHLEQR